jgi:hypothetical protein
MRHFMTQIRFFGGLVLVSKVSCVCGKTRDMEKEWQYKKS